MYTYTGNYRNVFFQSIRYPLTVVDPIIPMSNNNKHIKILFLTWENRFNCECRWFCKHHQVLEYYF